MKSLLVIPVIMLMLCCSAHAQPLIGMSKEQVAALIEEEHRAFRKDQSVSSQQFNYLKYVNGTKTKTWIMYFSGEDVCTGTKLVCDYSELDEMLGALNSQYRKTGRREWEYEQGTDTFRVNLTREEWYFTVHEKKIE